MLFRKKIIFTAKILIPGLILVGCSKYEFPEERCAAICEAKRQVYKSFDRETLTCYCVNPKPCEKE